MQSAKMILFGVTGVLCTPTYFFQGNVLFASVTWYHPGHFLLSFTVRTSDGLLMSVSADLFYEQEAEAKWLFIVNKCQTF